MFIKNICWDRDVNRKEPELVGKLLWLDLKSSNRRRKEVFFKSKPKYPSVLHSFSNFTFLPAQTNKTSLAHHLPKTGILNAWEIVIFISYRPYLGHSFLPAEQLENVPFSQINKTFM